MREILKFSQQNGLLGENHQNFSVFKSSSFCVNYNLIRKNISLRRAVIIFGVPAQTYDVCERSSVNFAYLRISQILALPDVTFLVLRLRFDLDETFN